jgi:hypothetical protein
MFSTTYKRPLAAVAVAAGLLVAAAPASAMLQSSSLATTVASIASDGQGASHVPYAPPTASQ